MISPITNQGLVRVAFFAGPIDFERYIVSLKGLIRNAKLKVFLIVDNLRVHRANPVRNWVAANTEKIELLYLPPYASELTSGENVNRDLKTTTRSGPITSTIAALLDKARACLERIHAMPDRVRSYFIHEYVRRAQQYIQGIARLIAHK